MPSVTHRHEVRADRASVRDVDEGGRPLPLPPEGSIMSQVVPASPRSVPPTLLATLAVGVPLLFWSYWTTFATLAQRWWDDPQYSHGFLVPAFVVALLYLREGQFRQLPLRTNWWGLALIVLGAGVRLFGAYFYISWFDNISLIPVLAGFVLLVAGWPALKLCLAPLAFLIFMMPLPHSIETAMAYEMRRLATITSTYALQTFGFSAIAEGTDIYLANDRLEVAPACSGMGMLVIFFALSSAIALISKRPWLDKVIILLSAMPIAILANIIRITITAVLYQFSSRELAHKIFHDGAGWLMMIVALIILWLELYLLDRILVPAEAKRPVRFGLDVMAPRVKSVPRLRSGTTPS